MAANFTLRFLRNKASLKRILKGDFDGSSAHVLVNTLKRNSGAFRNILVDTDGLKSVHPFGQGVLADRLADLGRKSAQIVFTGRHRDQLCSMPE